MSHVHIARCPDYDEARVEDAIRGSVAALGGIAQFVKAGQRVILKPNLLRPTLAERHLTTHPAVVKAVVRLVQEADATPIIMDSPAGPHNRAYLRLVYNTTGMEAVAQATGATVNDDMRSTRVPYPEGHLLKLIDMLAVVAEADAIINLPKLKTHNLTILTGAVKNLFGVIPGVTKAGYHGKLRTADRFAQMLIDVTNYCHPVLTIMDAIIGMEGNGPSVGDLREVGAILASPDGIALDVVAASLVGMRPLSVPPLAVAAEWGLTTGRIEDIRLSGVSLAKARAWPPFALPKTAGQVRAERSRWTPFAKYLVVNPSANSHCSACGTCVRSCPVQAISIVDKCAHMDLDKCIRCYCCHELCPENAVDLKRHWLAELILR